MDVFKNITLYENMIKYAKSVIYNNKSKISHIDLVHDLILSDEISEDNYKQKIKSLFFIERRCKDKHSDVDSLQFEWHGSKVAENVYSTACKKCQESYPSDFFRNRVLSNGFIQIYYICKKCESADTVVRRRRKDPITGLNADQKRHIKRKATDPNYLKKRVIAMQEYRRRKAIEKQRA